MLHLRYFVAVAEELNFSQAARRLHMAASPLSQRIKDLEHELGQQLFERSTHRVRLTPAGAALLPLARDILERVNAIPWRLREAVHPQRSTIFVGMPTGVHPDLRDRIKLLEQRCRERYDLKRWPGTSDELIAAVRDGRLALCLARLPVAGHGLEAIEVMTERLGAVIPVDRFAGRRSVRLADLADLPYVVSSVETPAYYEQLDTHLNAVGVRKRLRTANTGPAGVAELVSSGIAFSISVLDTRSPLHRYALDNVGILPFDDFAPKLSTALLWRRNRAEKGADLEELIGQVREIFAEPIHI